jgi:glycosyltransferase involved in cell wall biosynthesis
VIRLLAVTHYQPYPGGSSRSCTLLWHSIAARGHGVHVLAAITPEWRDYDAAHSGPESLTVSRYEMPFYHLSLNDTGDFLRYQEMEHERIRRALPDAIDRFRPGVVVAAHETLAGGVIDVAKAKGLPCAVMLRGSPTWQIVSGLYPEDLTRTYLDLFRRADLVIAVGDYMRAGLCGRGLGNVIHIPNLLDLEKFSPGPRDADLAARYGIGPDQVVAMHASVMSPRKRPEDVLHAAALALPEAPNLTYLFLGGEERGRPYEELNERLGLSARVRFVYDVPYDQMPDHLRLADVVILASAGEGIARVALETQACGRTLISSDIPAGREVVEHGVTGLLFRMADVKDLAEQTLRAYLDPDLRASLGAAARRRMGVHEIGRVTDRYVEAFAGLAVGGVSGAARRLPHFDNRHR